MCNCLEEINEKYREQTGDNYAGVCSIFSFDFGSLPKLEAHHRFKKKDGTLINRNITETIIPTYCPFCGKKYDE